MRIHSAKWHPVSFAPDTSDTWWAEVMDKDAGTWERFPIVGWALVAQADVYQRLETAGAVVSPMIVGAGGVLMPAQELARLLSNDGSGCGSWRLVRNELHQQ